MKKLLFFGFLTLIFINGKAQQNPIPSKLAAFDLALGVGSSVSSGALSFNQTHGLLASKKLRLGYGLRLSAFSGSELTYITAPAKLTKEPATVDTFNIKSPLSMGLSATLHIEYLLSQKLRVGFNIDIVGLGFGSSQNGDFISSENIASKYPNTVPSKPTAFNLLLIGDNDIGQLKSEFYLGYSLSERFMIRSGLDMTFSEYRTEQKLTQENDRFRYKAMLFFAAVSFSPFK